MVLRATSRRASSAPATAMASTGPSLVTPGVPVTLSIRMSATSNAFLPGHRIRLDITSSCFPSFDRNHNTAADQNADAELRSADQTVLHGGDQPTRILLPVIETSADGVEARRRKGRPSVRRAGCLPAGRARRAGRRRRS